MFILAVTSAARPVPLACPQDKTKQVFRLITLFSPSRREASDIMKTDFVTYGGGSAPEFNGIPYQARVGALLG